jgi:lipid-A-disaccharide synthase-like uncharacterized protein
MNYEMVWIALGFAAQGCFSARFVWQWIVSERSGRSQIPVAFWYLSLAGGSLLFSYALHRRDPVFILGQGLGLIVYARNLRLIYKAGTGGPGSADHASHPTPAEPRPASQLKPHAWRLANRSASNAPVQSSSDPSQAAPATPRH